MRLFDSGGERAMQSVCVPICVYVVRDPEGRAGDWCARERAPCACAVEMANEKMIGRATWKSCRNTQEDDEQEMVFGIGTEGHESLPMQRYSSRVHEGISLHSHLFD
eukprot:6196490-Pleurochrysis_carterae.AAC.2